MDPTLDEQDYRNTINATNKKLTLVVHLLWPLRYRFSPFLRALLRNRLSGVLRLFPDRVL